MGNAGGTITNKQISASQAVSEAFMAVSQDIAQSVSARQLVTLDCGGPEESEACVGCIDSWKKLIDERGGGIKDKQTFIQDACSGVCNCTLDKINMDSIVTIDMNAFLNNTSASQFSQQVNNSIVQQAQSKETSIFPICGIVTGKQFFLFLLH